MCGAAHQPRRQAQTRLAIGRAHRRLLRFEQAGEQLATLRLGCPEVCRRHVLVAEHTDRRQLGFLGQPRVRVTELNVALGLTTPGCAENTQSPQG